MPEVSECVRVMSQSNMKNLLNESRVWCSEYLLDRFIASLSISKYVSEYDASEYLGWVHGDLSMNEECDASEYLFDKFMGISPNDV